MLFALLACSPEVARDATWLLCSLAAEHPPCRRVITAAGALEPLVAVLLGAASPAVQSAAAGALANLLGEHITAGQAEVAAAGIPALVDLLESDSPAAQERAAAALANLAAASVACQQAIGESGSVPPLVALLASEHSPAVQEQAARALCNLSCRNPASLQAIAAAGGIPPLLDLLASEHPSVVNVAAGALAHLACDPANRQEIASAGGIQLLLHLLGCGSAGVQAEAAEALRLCAGDPATRPAIAAAGGIAPLVALLGSKSTTLTQAQAAWAVYHLVRDQGPRAAGQWHTARPALAPFLSKLVPCCSPACRWQTHPHAVNPADSPRSNYACLPAPGRRPAVQSACHRGSGRPPAAAAAAVRQPGCRRAGCGSGGAAAPAGLCGARSGQLPLARRCQPALRAAVQLCILGHAPALPLGCPGPVPTSSLAPSKTRRRIASQLFHLHFLHAPLVLPEGLPCPSTACRTLSLVNYSAPVAIQCPCIACTRYPGTLAYFSGLPDSPER